MLAERSRRFSHEFKREALVMAARLSAHATEELMQIPEFRNDEALAILKGQELGTIEAKRHDDKKILRFVRKQDTVDILVEGKKNKDQTERQKTLTLPADCNRTPSRLPVFEYSESHNSECV